MKIAIASDHGGFKLKGSIIAYLKDKDIDIKDFGTNSEDSCDYPIFANLVCKSILNQESDLGILICGTGIGMQMAANRYKGIRAVCTTDCYSAKMSKEHNNSNVLTLGQRVLGEGSAIQIVETWLNSKFQGGRHQRRIDMLDLDNNI